MSRRAFDVHLSAGAAISGRSHPSARSRWFAAIASALAVAALPALAAWPPVLDLAPQFDQVVLLSRVWAGERTDLFVDAPSANRLGYVPLFVSLLAAGPIHGHRLGLALVLLLAVLSIHAVAAVRGRSPAAAVLASTFVLATPLYAGFFNFLSGLGALAFWAWELGEERRDRRPAGVAASTLIGALWLYCAHVVWLAVGGLWIAVVVLSRRDRLTHLLARAAGAAPALALAWRYRAEVVASDWGSTTFMVSGPLERIGSWRAVSSLLWGGLREGPESWLLALVLIWVLAGAVAARRGGGDEVDRVLVAAAVVFAAFALLAPDKVDRAIFFALRWGPIAALCAVLALPAPRSRSLAWLAAGGALLALLVSTGFAWRQFGRDEMRGFEAALRALPARASLLGLDFERRSPRFVVHPYLQMGAYASVAKHARLGFSFTQLGTSLVRERSRSPRQARSMHLLWHPENVEPADLRLFDFLLVRGTERVAASLVAQTGVLTPVAGEGSWHLLAVDHDELERRFTPGSREN